MIRVRFAPSPTGPLHIGGVRTALYNYLYARKHGGRFILRIEDTDQKRYVEGAERYITEALSWLGMDIDEGPQEEGAYKPYRQSERSEIYKEHVRVLLDSGAAYYAFDTPEELDAIRKDVEKNSSETFKYDHTRRDALKNSLSLSAEEVSQRLESGAPYVVRLKIMPGQKISFKDIVRGEVSFESGELDDKVLMKADGLPTYHMANVVDDHLMEISHVIRGEEWLSSTAHHVMLYRAFGWEEEMPDFAHLPLILKPQGKGKLSKRDGSKFGIPVFPLEWKNNDQHYDGFRENGFIPAGMINFLALLGWNPGTDEEIFTMKELIETFDLDRVIKSGARFDYTKAKWFNEQHLKSMADTDIIAAYSQNHPEWSQKQNPSLEEVLPIIKDRLQVLNDIEKEAQYFYHAPTAYDPKTLRKKWKEDSEDWYINLQKYLEAQAWGTDLEEKIKTWMKENELGFGQVLPILRLALCGEMSGPSVFKIMELIGKEETLGRLQSGLEYFREHNA